MANGKKEVPAGVKIISVLYYIGAGLSVLAAIGFIIAGSKLADIPILSIFSGLVFAAVIGFIAMAILDFFLGRGLWRAQKWARIVVIILAILAFIGAVINLVRGQLNSIISLVVTAIIGGYLLFSKEVKQAFA